MQHSPSLSPSTYPAEGRKPKRAVCAMLGDSGTKVSVQREDAQGNEVEDEMEGRRAADFGIVANEDVVHHAWDGGAG